MTTKEKIYKFIKKNGQASAKELSDYLEISDRGVRKQLKNMLEQNVLHKIGRPPKVFYFLKKEEKRIKKTEIDEKTKKIIEDGYLIITPAGEKISGWKGFEYWAQKTNQKDIRKIADQYTKRIKDYNKIKKNDLIDGTKKIENTFGNSFVDKIFYVDFYSIPQFGKTKLGQLLLYAKQSQDKKIIREIAEEVKEKINFIIKNYQIEAVIFVPPTVRREIQFMKELEKFLNINKKIIKIEKIKTEVIVPQKTLSKLEDRIENASKTFFIQEKGVYKNILIIDDAIGSGATINEIARKIKNQKIYKGKIIGLAITGSLKGFDIISEV